MKNKLSHYPERLQQEAWLLLKNMRHRLNPESIAKVTFVAGVQRSGTNMVMDILERSPVTDVYHESDKRAFDNYLMRDIETIKRLHQDCRSPHFVIKALCELQRLPEFLQIFSGGKVIWIFRHYEDVVNSMVRSFRNHAKQIQRLAINKSSDGWRGEGMSDETQALLQRCVHPDMNDETGAALMWYLRNKLFFEKGLNTRKDVFVLRYEGLVSNPEVEFKRMFEFAGIPFKEKYTRKVFKSSIRRRSPPEIDEAVRIECDKLLGHFVSAAIKQQEKSKKVEH